MIADLLHVVEIQLLQCRGFFLRLGELSRVGPEQFGPLVGHHVDFRLRTGDGLGEVGDALGLPTRLQRPEPLGVGGFVVSLAHQRRCALEDVQLLASLGQLGHRLYRGGTGADDADALVGEVHHLLGGAPSRVGVVPTTGVEHVSLEAPDALDVGKLGAVQHTTRDDHELRGEIVTTTGGGVPALRFIIPTHVLDLGLEEGTGIQVERATQQLAVREDLVGLHVLLGGHVTRLLQKWQVHVRLHVARTVGVAVPVPGATEVAGQVDHAEVRDAGLQQMMSGEHSSESGADDHDLGLFSHRVAGEVGVDEGVSSEIGPFTGDGLELGGTVGAQTLLALDAVLLANLLG